MLEATPIAGMWPVSVYMWAVKGVELWWVCPVAGFGVDHANHARRVEMTESSVALPNDWKRETHMRWVSEQQWRALFAAE